MLKIFPPPILRDNDTHPRQKIFIFIVLGAAFMITVLEALLCFILPQNYYRWITILIVFDSVSFFLLILSMKGYVKTASFGFVAFIMVIIFSLAWTSGGIKSHSFRFIPILVLGAGLFMGTRSGIYVGIISLIGSLLLVVTETFQILPQNVVAQNSWSIFFNSAALIGILIVLQYVTVENIENALKKAESNLKLLTKKESELRKSEEFRRAVFESSRVPIVVMDAVSFKYIDCNPAAVEIYQSSSKEETINKNPIYFSAPTQYDGLPSEEKARYYIEKALAEGSVVFEWKHQRPSGDIWDAEVHLMSFSVDGTKLLQFSLIDITEKKKNENEIRRLKEYFESVFNYSPLSIVISRLEDGFIVDVNEMFTEHNQSKKHEALGKTNLELNLWEYQEDREEFVNHIKKHGFYKNRESKLLRKDGTSYISLLNSTKIDLAGIPHLITISQDITEKKKLEETVKESEEKFRTLFENASDSISLIENGVFIDCNLKTLEMFGCLKRDQIIGRYPFEISPQIQLNGRTSQELAAEKISATLSGVPQFFEWIHKKMDGTLFNAEVSLNKIELRDKILIQAIVRDVTERKRAAEKLRESEERYRNMIQILPDGVAIITDGKLAYLNDSACKIVKAKQPQDIIGTYAIEHVHPDYREAGQKRWADILSNKTTAAAMELKYLDQNKNPLDVQAALTYLDYTGKPSILVVFKDITERKRAEIELKDSEKRYRYLFKQNPLPMLIYELQSLQILSINDAFTKHYGFSEEEALKLSLTDLYPEKEKIQISNLTQTLKGHAYAGEWHHIQKDGTQITIEAYSHGFELDGRAARIAVVNDITKRKQAEEELNRYKDRLVEMVEERTRELEESRETFRALAENTKDVIARINDRYQFLYVNNSIKDVFNITAENYTAKTLAELNFPLNLVTGLERIVKQVFETKQNHHTEFQLENGIWADLIAMPEFDSAGDVISVIISARDITKLKKLQMDMEEALEKEKELNQLKNRFVSMVSHEYRTPLTSILSSIEILEMGEEKYTKEKKKVHYNRIQKNIDFMIDMIDEVLYVNRIDSHRVEISLQKTDLSKFCTDLLEEIKELYPEIKSTIKINLEEREYRIDEAIMKKILGNLITNAYKYNKPDGEMSFIIKSEKDKLIFDIRDTGIGIPEEEQKNVFEPFSRMTNTQNVKGTGLGLSIVKKSVEQLGGNVSFTSRKDEGSTFKVILPIN